MESFGLYRFDLHCAIGEKIWGRDISIDNEAKYILDLEEGYWYRASSPDWNASNKTQNYYLDQTTPTRVNKTHQPIVEISSHQFQHALSCIEVPIFGEIL
jgi:hypothetical protein